MKNKMTVTIVALFTGLIIFSPSSKINSTVEGDNSSAIANSTNSFALDLYGRFAREKGNIFFSPVSISTALTMTYAGAKGKTAEEMKTTLHLNFDENSIHSGFGKMLENLTSNKKDFKILIANALWGDKREKFLPSFTSITKKYYRADLKKVDFVNNTEKAREKINKWAEKKTMGKITNLIPPGLLNRDTSLIITNAIYFKGLWNTPFNKDSTKEMSFWTDEGKETKAKMMFLKNKKFKFIQKDGFSAIEMPYRGKDISMFIFLPEKRDGLPQLESSLTKELIDETIASMETKELGTISIPRFTLTYGKDISETLKAMGMPTAFGGADFSGITGDKSLKISAVLHKAFVEVNEEGTEAAAATAVIMTRALEIKPSFIADHPFIFLIRHNKTGCFLFMGRITKP